ncbi:two-component sensor histidine kinase [Scytonema sp. UIC 10036]|uniref:two-component system sensor histidine kinase RppB n=1 Tax=Scytonema sp. UIC 10036 TaxID=2304196 RepID=UPI0012DAEAD3|nr:two-component system sensor histidine kinase RppB [Scytonema sp. UIC 10036]MUH00773.1 two-component sensor histidine kinase [Scytonema sp. UIC 10036]
MNQHKLFTQTRLRLAGWYAVVMGFILSLCGLGVYEAIVHAHWQTLDRELEAVAGTLHDSIENELKQPERLEPSARQLLPEREAKRHILGAVHHGNYYVRLLDRAGRVVATAGFEPKGLPVTPGEIAWQNLKDASGNRYHQISLELHTRDHQIWGHMQMGRSLQDVDRYLANVRLALFLGLPVAMILVGGASWWLSGLAMLPIYKSYRQVEQFTADAAHELRTPLAAAQATVESALLMSYLDDKEARDILTTIQRQNQRLTTLVTDLLLLARMDRQVVSVKQERCCLNDIVNDLVEELAALAIAYKVDLKSEVRKKQPLYALGHEDQIYRLISNLIVNGIQYTPIGGQVKVILDSDRYHAIIQVQDSGIGIAPHEQKRIFDRFYRVNSDRSRSTGGSGLGLAIARAIVQAHKGSLSVQSELGKGSTFTILLPLI